MLRLVTRAERVAQFILVKGTEGLRFAPARPRVVTHARRHIHNHPHRRQHQLSIGENPSVHLAFKPSLRLQAQASTNTASFGNTSPRPTNSAQAPPITAQSPLPNSAPIKKPPPSATPTTSKQDLANGFGDKPIVLDEGTRQVDWARSFHGLSTEAFSKEAAEILCGPLVTDDIEVKPDGMIYLPEIKYRRILNKAFGPGGWGLAPRSETIVTPKKVTREYALVAHGRLVSVARGEQDYFSPEGIPTATEGCKSNAMMRCCKDLGVASELWDPRFVRGFLKSHAREVFVEHQATKKRSKIWLRKDDSVKYPLKETKFNA